jgi:hypothetical protein
MFSIIRILIVCFKKGFVRENILSAVVHRYRAQMGSVAGSFFNRTSQQREYTANNGEVKLKKKST